MNVAPSRHWRARVGLLALAAALGGCATAPPPGPPVPQDPWEAWNREVYAFNQALDDAVLRPAATAYRDHVPELLRTWFGNFLGHFNDMWSTVNHLLQGKPGDALHMGFRVLTNTVLGFGGFIDVATEARLDKRSEDFGQTLGVWGLPDGPYLVLPLLGPSTLRDTTALALDLQASPVIILAVDRDRILTALLGIVHVRSTLFDAERLIGEIALDRYQFVRDGYLQRRRSLIYDGHPPPTGDEFDYDVDDGDDEDVAPEPAAGPASGPAR